MNKVILMGRLTREPDVRYSAGENASAVARYTLAVDRRFARRDDPNAQTADFIGCVAFGRQAEFAEKYLHQGTKIAITGRIQTGSYTNREGQKVYTTDIVVEEQEFAESKAAAGSNASNYESPRNNGGFAPESGAAPSMPDKAAAMSDGFMNVPKGAETDDDLPW